MKGNIKILAAACGAIIMATAGPAMAATVLFDGGTPNATTMRAANSGLGQSIAVTTATTLHNIGFYSASPSGGNIKYLIFDGSGSNLLFSITAAATNLSSGISLVESPTFDFNLAAGSSYQFGIISDSALNVGYDIPASFVSQNGLTSFGLNTNYSSFMTPVLTTKGKASIPVVLYDVQSAVPEPATWAMMIVGLGAVGFAMRRKNVTTRLQFA